MKTQKRGGEQSRALRPPCPYWAKKRCLVLQAYNSVFEHLWKGKTIFILQRALPLTNLKINGNIVKGTKGQRMP